MKASAIDHRGDDDILIIRQSFLDICKVVKADGSVDTKATANAGILLSYFVYWHDVKVRMNEKNRVMNNVSERHGDGRSQDESLFQYHSTDEIIAGCMGMISLLGVRSGRRRLIELGFLSEHKNPNPRYSFDNTVFYLVHTDTINSTLSYGHNDPMVRSKRPDGPTEMTGTSTETTTETTTNIKTLVQPVVSPKSEDENSSRPETDSKPPPTPSAKRKVFRPPGVDEIHCYMRERASHVEDSVLWAQANKFFDRNEAGGWMTGRTKMKDWKGAVRYWIGNDYDKAFTKSPVKRAIQL